MMASWAVVGYGTWKCQFSERIGVIVQSQKQEKSNGLIGYAKTLYDRQPAWLKARHPLKK